MPQSDRDKLNRIEELKGRLFSKNYQTKIEHRDSFTHTEMKGIPEAWESGKKADVEHLDFPEKFFMRTPIFKNFFIASIIFFIVALGYGAYVFFAGGNTVSNDNIDISILGNNFTAGGEELALVIGITNRNNSPLQLADLVMEYPKSSSSVDADLAGGTERSRVSLGTIQAGSVRNENLKVTLFGQQGTVRPIRFSLEYRVEGSNAIFVKEKLYEVTISSTPLNLTVDAPLTASPNQDITFKIKATLNATKPASKILLKLDYPVGFQFGSSVPGPTLGNNVWSLGDLAPGAVRSVSVTGKMLDVVDGEEKTFHIISGSQSSDDKSNIDVVFNSLSHTVTIKKPFIEAKLFVNGESDREYASNSKSPIRGEIQWTNNLDTKVNDLEIRAKISGNAVDRKTINAERGFYDSSSDEITWDRNSVNEFEEINPGDSGSVKFSVSPLSLYSAGGGLIPNPTIKIDISISGRQLVEGYAAADLNNTASGIVRIISDVGLGTKALYYSGPFQNTGPIPPKVENETTYAVVWSLSSTANTISKASVRSSIPSWVRFVGPSLPSEEDLSYNSSSKEIIWRIGNIPKGTGVTGAGRSVSFQIAFTPSLSQVGALPVLINDAILTGHDDFANVDVKVSKTSLRTELDSDPQFSPGAGTVVE